MVTFAKYLAFSSSSLYFKIATLTNNTIRTKEPGYLLELIQFYEPCIHFAHLVRDYSTEPELVQLQRLVPSNILLFLFGTASPLIFVTVIVYAHLDAV